MKRCARCGEEKTRSEFHRDKNRSDGLYPWCKSCRKARAAAHYRKNRKRIIEQTNTYRRANLDKGREWSRRWRKRNPEYIEANRERARRATREWVRANPERKKNTDLHYRMAHPEVHARTRLKRRANPEDRPGHEAQDYIAILYGDPCALCGAEGREIDHIEPRPRWAFGVVGWNAWSNLTILCRSCNRRKTDKPLLAFLLDLQTR